MNISVVIPLFNKEEYIQRAIISVINQTTPFDELIVIDDGSMDNSARAVKKIDDARIKLIHQKNAGECAARNRGIIEARNQLIALLDADDEWKPGFLGHIKRLFNNFPDCGIYATAYTRMLLNGDMISPLMTGLPHEPWIGILPDYFRLIQNGMIFNSSSVAVNKQYCLLAGGFPEGVSRGGDKMAWIRMALRFPIAYSPSPQSIYHKEAENRACNIHIINDEKPYCLMIEEMFANNEIPTSLIKDVLDYYTFEQLDLTKQLIKSSNFNKARKLLGDIKNNKKYRLQRSFFFLLTILPHGLVRSIIKIFTHNRNSFL